MSRTMTSRRLLWRFVGIFTSFAVIIIVFIGIVLNITVQNSYYNSFQRTLETGYVLWCDYRGFDPRDLDNTSVHEIARLFRDENDGRNFFDLFKATRNYTLFDAGGKEIIASNNPLYTSVGEKELMLSLLSSRNALAAMAGEVQAADRRLIYEGNTAYFDYAMRLELKEGSYILYFRYDRQEWLETLNSLNRNIATSMLTAVLLSVALGFVMSRAVTEPLVRIKNKARDIASGNFDVDLEVKSGDEIGDLTRSFNHMAEELKSTMIAISSEKSKIETLLNFLTDGVAAFDLLGKAIHVNPAATRLADITEGMDFDGFTSAHGVQLSLRQLLDDPAGGSREETLKISERYLKAFFAVYTDREHKNEGIILVLQDITEMERIDRMRKEFVENVSHELKTPLATIKSYVETLLDGALEQQDTARRFMEVVSTETDRMTRLVKDLLLLSSIDYLRSGGKSITLEKRRISIADLAQRSTEKLRLSAANKKQTLECVCGERSPYVYADRDRMEQVVLNLIGNSIKYTPEGGSIRVTTGMEGSFAWLRVSDNGIGIPKKDLERIFERFARVDKARSREMGGTGLGLAIVREIVNLHSGRIDIRSNLDAGTEITVYLPIGNVITRIDSAGKRGEKTGDSREG